MKTFLNYNRLLTVLIIIFILVILFILLHIYLKKKESFSNYTLPKTIYTYWDDLDNNIFIKKNIEDWQKKIKNWKIVVITNDNLHEYVDDTFIKTYYSNKIKIQHFSDFLRIKLLIENGGLWMDPSIIILNSEFINSIYNEMHNNRYDISLFEYPNKSFSKNSLPYLENWFIMAPKNSNLLVDLQREFNKAHEMSFIMYKKDILIPSNIDLSPTIGYDDNTYLMQHAIINLLMFINNYYKINIKNANDSMFFLQNKYNWDSHKIKDHLLNEDISNLYAIKFTGGNRDIFNNHMLLNTLYSRL